MDSNSQPSSCLWDYFKKWSFGPANLGLSYSEEYPRQNLATTLFQPKTVLSKQVVLKASKLMQITFMTVNKLMRMAYMSRGRYSRTGGGPAKVLNI